MNMSMQARQLEPREGVGRLLRLVQDSELFHMECAIDEYQFKHQQLLPRLSDSSEAGSATVELINTSAREGRAAIGIQVVGGTEEMVPRPLSKRPERLLTLADHKCIVNLQLVLDAIDRAMLSTQVSNADRDAHRNLLSALMSALITQTMNNCSTTKENCCVWTSEARKLLALLYWMAAKNPLGDGSVAELLLTWISSERSTDKAQQMAGALVLFELIQCHRQRVAVSPVLADPEDQHAPPSSSLLGSSASEFVRELVQLTRQGRTTVNAAKRLKLTNLGLVALEALLAVLCDQAAWLSDAGHASSSSDTQAFLEGVDIAISTLQQYHSATSARKTFLLLALHQLNQYPAICRATMARTISGASAASEAAIEMLGWHWNASAMLLCTRSDAALRIRKAKPLAALKAEILRPSAVNNAELLAARLRQLCVLLSFAPGSRGSALLDELARDLEAKGKLIIMLVRGLKAGIEQKNQWLVDFATQILQVLIRQEGTVDRLDQQVRPTQLFETKDDWRALMALLMRTFKNTKGKRHTPTSLEHLIADFALQSQGTFLLSELQRYSKSTDTSSVLAALYLIPVIINKLQGSDPHQRELFNMWRRQLSPVVADVLARQDASLAVVQEAMLCVPLLDIVYFTRLFTILSDGVHEHVSTVGLALLFASSCGKQENLEMTTAAFIDACRHCAVDQSKSEDEIGSKLASPGDWTRYTQPTAASPDSHSESIQCAQEFQERVLSRSSAPNGWIRVVKAPEKRIQILQVLLRKLFGAPRDPFSLRFLRELVATGWLEAISSSDETTGSFHAIVSEVTWQMKHCDLSVMQSQTRLSEKLLEDRASAVEALLFARLAPVLVLRVLPRAYFVELGSRRLHCEQEDMTHLEEAVSQASDSDDEELAVDRKLFHLLVLQVVDPLEFKEVKMLAVEILAKLPPSSVTPFVLAYLLAFLREEVPMLPATPFTESLYEPALQSLRIPDSCGVITAKLMVYYLNRVINEDLTVFKDTSQVPFILAILLQVMSIPSMSSNGAATERDLLADLQLGCMDCIALLILRQLGDLTSGGEGSVLLDVLVDWIIFDNVVDGDGAELKKPTQLAFAVEMVLLSLVSSAPHQQQSDLSLPLQVRICGCNILLSVIERLDANTLSAFRASRAMPRLIASVSMANFLREEIVAGSLQVLFTFVYKTDEALSVKNEDDLQLMSECMDMVLERLESSSNQQVCMNALKVVGAIMGKLPEFFGAVSEEKYRLLVRTLQSVRERSTSVAKTVSDFAQSLLNALVVVQ